MKKIKDFIVEHSKLIVIVSLLLLIPAIIGYRNTRVNYDILVYLKDSVETVKGEKILTEDFQVGSYAFVMVEDKTSKQILELEQKVEKIDGVNRVFSIADVIGTTIPYEMLPDEVKNAVYKDGETVIFVTFRDSISSDETIHAVRQLRSTVDDASKVSSMTSMIIDTMDLSNKEMAIYVIIAVLFCFIVLTIATDSYFVPILLLGNIGVAILYNMGTNLFLGEISYITKAITAVLQLGVTTDFSIFLYHKYENAKDRYPSDNKEAMKSAITETFQSVIGSSLTTFAGFLALCTMDLTLGTDIGIVMAKGVLCGLICVLTLFPALLLVFDKTIEKTKHRNFFPKFQSLAKFSVKHYKFIFILFLILLVPAIIGNSRYEVYYKLDQSLPHDLPFYQANEELKEKFNIISPELILLDRNMKPNEVENLVTDLKNLEGIDLVLSPSTMMSEEMKSLLPKEITELIESDKYQLVLVNSTYEIASKQLNEQMAKVSKIVKHYDENGMIAGEGALMTDLVTIAAHDFQMVNYTSLFVIFIIMVIVLQSFGLPIILILAIEFAIFLNMSISYFTSVELPFIASILVGTIQLGATIDYAILISTKYLEIRRKNVDKKQAMKETLELSIPSIITSALCFFAATIGVVLYTKIDMIGSICELLARGALISMAVVIFILPALLILFDTFILKTTKLKKEGLK